MRDPIREADIERRIGITAGEVAVDVADDGTATVTLKHDHLDRLAQDPVGVHDECGEYDLDDIADAHAEGYRDGYETGRKAAIKAIQSTAAAS